MQSIAKRSYVLTYHSIDDSGSVISTAPAVFRQQMDYLAENRVPVVELGELESTEGAVSITFDDGFRNLIQHALPVLAQYRFPATIFAVSGFCGKRNDWPTQRTNGIPVLDLMDWNELRQASDAGFTIGAHTVTHPYLTAIAETAAATEMRISRDSIEQRIGVPVTSFAYPYGSWNATIARLAGELFERACTTELKPVTPDSHALSLPRLDTYYLHSRFLFENFRSVPGRTYLEMRRLLRNLRTANSVNPLRGSLCQSTPLPTP